MKKALLIIDPQKDFMTSPDFTGSLSVQGAYEDMLRLAKYINNQDFEDIFVTLDTHQRMDIAHHAWWKDSQGNHPPAFTLITVEDVKSKKWLPVDESLSEYALFYVNELQKNNRYTLLIWPDHCIDGTVGYQINDELKESLIEWENKTGKKVTYVFKGTNPKTEHYSGLKAEVVLDDAEETKLNVALIEQLASYDMIEIAGEALSHCVGNTAVDLLENFPEQKRQNVSLLTDCMSSVTGFEKAGEDMLMKIRSLGANLKIAARVRLTI